MKYWVIDAVGTAHEQYLIQAETEAEARAKFAAGDLPQPRVSEVDDSEIVSVREEK